MYKTISIFLLLTVVAKIDALDTGTCTKNSYTCVDGKEQNGHEISYKTHVYTRDDCAELCCKNRDCIVFDYDQKWKKCWLSNTSWKSAPLTAGMFNMPLANRWACQKKGSSGE